MTVLRQRKQGWPLEEGRSLDRWYLHVLLVMILSLSDWGGAVHHRSLICLARCWRFRSLLWQEEGLWKWRV